MSDFQLNDQVALVTGGGTGLGYGMAECFLLAGASVVITGRRDEVLRDAVKELGEQAAYVVGDVTETDSIEALVEKASEPFGAPSILINNAGIHLKKETVDTSPEEFQKVLQTHVIGAHALTRALIPSMIERGSGSIVFISSMAALMGINKVIAYSAAKSAYVGMTRTLSAELSPHGIRVNAIAPGWIESTMLRKALDGDPERTNKILQRTHMGKFGESADIGNAAVFLCSPAAKFVTGVLLPVDGGASVGF